MRTFVATTLPDDVRTALAADVGTLPSDLRGTSPSRWHLTLAFLGDVSSSGREIADLLTPRIEPFEVVVDSAGRFGDRVLWIGVASNPPRALPDLARDVRTALAPMLPAGDGRFRPHVTVARAGRSPVRRRHAQELAGRVRPHRWTVRDLAVVHSQLGDGPAVHEVVATVPL